MIKYLPVFLFTLLNFTSAVAEDLAHDTQAFIYYKIPIGGSSANDRAHEYGFRMDQSWIDRDQPVDMNSLMKRNAMMDFRMSSREAAKFEIHGVDYLQKYLASRADEAASEGAEAGMMEEAAAEAPAAESAEPAPAPVETAEAEKGFGDEMMDSLTDIPLGIYIGIAIVGAMVAGG